MISIFGMLQKVRGLASRMPSALAYLGAYGHLLDEISVAVYDACVHRIGLGADLTAVAREFGLPAHPKVLARKWFHSEHRGTKIGMAEMFTDLGFVSGSICYAGGRFDWGTPPSSSQPTDAVSGYQQYAIVLWSGHVIRSDGYEDPRWFLPTVGTSDLGNTSVRATVGTTQVGETVRRQGVSPSGGSANLIQQTVNYHHGAHERCITVIVCHQARTDNGDVPFDYDLEFNGTNGTNSTPYTSTLVTEGL